MKFVEIKFEIDRWDDRKVGKAVANRGPPSLYSSRENREYSSKALAPAAKANSQATRDKRKTRPVTRQEGCERQASELRQPKSGQVGRRRAAPACEGPEPLIRQRLSLPPPPNSSLAWYYYSCRLTVIVLGGGVPWRGE